MPLKPETWHRIAVALSVLNVAGAGFAIGTEEPLHVTVHIVLALGFAAWARRLRQGPGRSDPARMDEELEQQAAALEDAQATLAEQSRQLAELQERVDFAERVLAQSRDRLPAEHRDKLAP